MAQVAPKEAFVEPNDSPNDGENKSSGKMTGSVAEHGKGYCDQTTVHGFAYLTQGRNRCEVLFWALTIITMVTLGSIIISQSYK